MLPVKEGDRPVSSMRKYYRLLLVISSVFLLILFLYYELKYEQVRDVLHGMNVFGSRLAARECEERIRLERQHRIDVEASSTSLWMPSWTQVGDQVFIYSSYGTGTSVQSLAIIQGLISESNFGCEFWFQDNSIIKGRLSFVKLTKATLPNEGIPALLSCIHDKNITSASTGISYYSLERKYHNLNLVIPNKVLDKRSRILLGACVEPLPAGFNDVFKVAELISFYQTLGVEYLIFYDHGATRQVKEFFAFTSFLGSFVYLIPWNVPSSVSEVTDLHFVDCFQRLRNDFNVSHILKIKLNQFLRPTNRNLTEIIRLNSDDGKSPTILKFHSSVFCLNVPLDLLASGLDLPYVLINNNKQSMKVPKPTPLIFPASLDVIKVYKYLKHSSAQDKSIPKNEAILYQYNFCPARDKVHIRHNDDLRNVGLALLKSPLLIHVNKRYHVKKDFI